jgi:serine/threonine protein phosphatase PrpC
MSTVSIHETVAINFASQCDRGKVRAENQDTVRRVAVPLGDLLLVADGIGGYAGGGVASRMAVDVISSALADMPTFFPPALAIQEAACRANTEIAAAAAKPGTTFHHMGTTAVLALLQQDPEHPHAPVHAWVGHIGDSRAYLVRYGRLRRITRDHSAMQLLMDRGLITPEEARYHPDSSVLTRTLGHEPNVEMELNEVALKPGDGLLLCSDGLWGFVPEQEIERVLADSTLSVEEASLALLKLALDAGGHDNVGIELARVAGSSEPTDARDPADALETLATSEPLSAWETDLLAAPVLRPDSISGSASDMHLDSAAETAQSSDTIETGLIPQAELAQEQESKPRLELEFDYVPKFQSADLPNTSAVKMLMILTLAFAGSGALVYSALMQNWFGLDRFLH